MITITCKVCEHVGAPKNTGKDLVCQNCKEPFGYFQKTEYNYKLTQKRVEAERQQANKSITRGLKK